jgi:cobalt-zinc-cadmium resistance protein CzcA
MVAALALWSIRRRGAVLTCALLLSLLGVWSASRVPIDAMPDITGPQVQINTALPALAADEAESRVTIPLESELSGLPGLVEFRSLSKIGLSQVTLIFEDGTDIFRARQLVTERIGQASGNLPPGVVPVMAPISTGLGEIVYYTLEYADETKAPSDEAARLRELRLMHDTRVRPALRSTSGLADVNVIGGHERQMLIEPDLAKMAKAALPMSELLQAVRKNTENAGGGVISLGGEAFTVRADTRVRTAQDIAGIPLRPAGLGPAVTVGDVAKVSVGSASRMGAATVDGREAVVGAAIMLAGENSREVSRRAVEKLRVIGDHLPEGVRIRVLYDRSDLVGATIRTVETNLFEGAAIVVVVLLLLLGHWRAALIVALAIPLSFLLLLTGMAATKASANLMSLGAIDFGLIVDGSVVMVENFLRRLDDRVRSLGRSLSEEERTHELSAAASEVAGPMFLGVAVITLVYVPIFALEGIEGKMFKPMAGAVVVALAASALVALTVMPALASFGLRPSSHGEEGGLVRRLRGVFAKALAWCFAHRGVAILVTLLAALAAAVGFTRLGADFIPQLDEGSISIQFVRAASLDLGSSVELQKKSETLLRARFPEIDHIFARIGTAEIASDPMGPNVADTYLTLKPRETWRREGGSPINKARLVELMSSVLERTVPGQTAMFSQPIQLRFNEIMAGARADLSLKIFGDQLADMESVATQAVAVLRKIPGGGDVEFEASGMLPSVDIVPRRDQLVRRNLHAEELNEVVSVALGGAKAGQIPSAGRPLDVVVRLPGAEQSSLARIGDLPVSAEDGSGTTVALSKVADVRSVERPGVITREDARRRLAILINVRGRDTEGFVREAEARLKAEIKPVGGVYWEFGGQFENLVRARERLALVVPAALGLILLLIYAGFGSFRQAALVFTCVPLAATGGVLALWLRGMPFTISAGIGFIAVSGIAVLNGIMLISFINQLRAGGTPLREAVTKGTLTRLRPKLLTALVASLGFVPMALSTGPGAEVQQPLATVVIGGIITSTALTLLLLPVLYDWLESRLAPVSASLPSPNQN